MSENNRKVGSITTEQKNLLVEFMENHDDLKSGKFTKDFTFKKAQNMWEELSVSLNAIPGARKEWRQWRKTWHDLRTNAKSKQSKILKHKRGTGGGSPVEDILTPLEDRIVSLIGTTAIEGHAKIKESAATFDFVDILPTDSTPRDSVSYQGTTLSILSFPLPSEASSSQISLEPASVPEEAAAAAASSVATAPTPQKHPKTSRPSHGIQRLQKTVEATARLADATDEKIKIKENYYKLKLSLYERDVIAKERIANALDRLHYNSKK